MSRRKNEKAIFNCTCCCNPFNSGNNSCGIFNGRESETIAPDNYITREALAAVLYRYILDYKNAHLRVTVGVLNGYTDNNEISDSFRDAMIWAVSDGIITGVSATRLDPKGYVTRAQAATIAVRMRNLLIEKGIITEYETKGSINYDANKVGYIAPTLEQTSWEQVRAASRAGIADAVWNVGDEKKLYLDSGEVLTAQIYGFNHDDKDGSDGGQLGAFSEYLDDSPDRHYRRFYQHLQPHGYYHLNLRYVVCRSRYEARYGKVVHLCAARIHYVTEKPFADGEAEARCGLCREKAAHDGEQCAHAGTAEHF